MHHENNVCYTKEMTKTFSVQYCKSVGFGEFITARRGSSSYKHERELDLPSLAILQHRVQERDIPFQLGPRGIHHRLHGALQRGG